MRALIRFSLWLILLGNLLGAIPARSQESELLVDDFAEGQILRYDAKTGAFIDVFIKPGSGGIGRPTGMAVGPYGDLYVADFDNSRILDFDGQNGAYIGEFVSAGATGLDHPEMIRFGPDGNLYAASFSNSSVERYDGLTGKSLPASGNPGAIFVVPGSGGLSSPYALLFHRNGDLLVSSRNSNNILEYDQTIGAFVDEFVKAGSGGLNTPLGMAFGPGGNLFVTSRTNQVLKYNGEYGTFIKVFAESPSLFGTGLAFGPDKNLYVSDDHDNFVRCFSGTTGAFLEDFIPADTGSNLDHLLFRKKPIFPVVLTLTPGSIPASLSASEKITLAAAYAMDLEFTLATTNPATSIPASLTIPAGATSQTFSIHTRLVSQVTHGDISAILGTVTIRKAVTVRPIGVASFKLSTTTIKGGDTIHGTVTLEASAAPGSIAVTFASSNASAITPPASITIASGSKAASVDISTAVVPVRTTVTITATANGIAKSVKVIVTP